MWVLLATVSALCLGFYDVMKKLSVNGNNVLGVLFLNTLFGALFMLPVIIVGLMHGNYGLGGTLAGHGFILVKSGIVLASWQMCIRDRHEKNIRLKLIDLTMLLIGLTFLVIGSL